MYQVQASLPEHLNICPQGAHCLVDAIRAPVQLMPEFTHQASRFLPCRLPLAAHQAQGTAAICVCPCLLLLTVSCATLLWQLDWQLDWGPLAMFLVQLQDTGALPGAAQAPEDHDLGAAIILLQAKRGPHYSALQCLGAG